MHDSGALPGCRLGWRRALAILGIAPGAARAFASAAKSSRRIGADARALGCDAGRALPQRHGGTALEPGFQAARDALGARTTPRACTVIPGNHASG